MRQRILAGIILSLTAATSHAASYSFTTFDHPDATYRQVDDYTCFCSKTVFTSLVSDINDSGQIAGVYSNASGTHGYLFSAGAFTTLDDGSVGYINVDANGINNAGQVVGRSYVSGQASGYIYSGGTFTDFAVDGADGTFAEGIDDAGNVVGWSYEEAHSQIVYSFIYSEGQFTQSTRGIAYDINSSGQLVGADGYPSHGFLYSGDSVTELVYPDALSTGAAGINDLGQIVGGYADADGKVHGFLYSNSVFTTIDYPDIAGDTRLQGINNNGVIVGSVCDDAICHGIIATPVPLPAVGWLLAPAFGLAGWMRRRVLSN